MEKTGGCQKAIDIALYKSLHVIEGPAKATIDVFSFIINEMEYIFKVNSKLNLESKSINLILTT